MDHLKWFPWPVDLERCYDINQGSTVSQKLVAYINRSMAATCNEETDTYNARFPWFLQMSNLAAMVNSIKAAAMFKKSITPVSL